MTKHLFALALGLLLPACSGTYYDPADPYMRGIRFFDRREFAMARQHWEPLAAAGDCDARYRMGTLSFFGVGGLPQSYDAARKQWSVAADQGQAFAQILLATMYAHDAVLIGTPAMESWFNCEKGCGVDKDIPAAYRWMRLAERTTPYDGGRAEARRLADKYKRALTSEDAARADAEVEAWKPAPKQGVQRVIR